MRTIAVSVCVCVAIALCAAMWLAASPRATAAEPPKAAPVRFVKHVIDAELPAISAAAIDVAGHNDGTLDVIAAGGPSGGVSKWSNLVYWYKAPKWEKKLVCALDPKAIILHIEAVDLTTKHGEKVDPKKKPIEITITDGQLGHIWWYRYSREDDSWFGSRIIDNVPYAHGSAAADIDGDGYDDIVAPHQETGKPVGILWAKNPTPLAPSGSMWPTYPLAEKFGIKGWLHYVRVADLLGDNRPCVLLGSHDRSGWYAYYHAPANPADRAKPVWAEHRLEGPMNEGTNLDAADLLGRGKLDLIAADGHGVGLWCFPAPDFKPVRVDDTLKSAHSLAITDLNGDGKPDLASCGYDSKKAAVFLNRSTKESPVFERVVIDEDQAAYDIKAADINGDGKMDLLLSGQNSGNLVWYENVTGK